MTFDPGLQPERTSLSWNRTALSMVVGGVAGLKVLPGLVGGLGLAAAVAVVVAGAGLALVAHARSVRTVAVLLSGQGTLPDGRLLLAVAGAVGAVAAVAGVVVVLLAVRR